MQVPYETAYSPCCMHTSTPRLYGRTHPALNTREDNVFLLHFVLPVCCKVIEWLELEGTLKPTQF